MKPNELDNYPVFRCEVDGGLMKFWCPHCRVEHVHGADGAGGHRVAHCLPGSPYLHGGYILVTDKDRVRRRRLQEGR
jgi:hypothetical protein